MSKSIEEMAREEFFDCHACLTGDCPHEKTFECLTSAYLAGAEAKEKQIEELKDVLSEMVAASKVVASDWTRDVESAAEELLARLEKRGQGK